MRRTTGLALASLALVSVFGTGCKRKSERVESTTTNLSLAPLASPKNPIETMVVPGFGDAVVAAPSGATHPMPVVVAVLGIGDTPESQCQNWRDLVQGRAFVLCPRGLPHMVQAEGSADGGGGSAQAAAPEATDEGEATTAPREAAALSAPHQEGFYPSDTAALQREVDADLHALVKKYGAYVAPEGRVYVGFSRGAFLGASFVGAHPRDYARAVLIEGGHTPWTDASAKQFAAQGGKRLIFACGQPSCVDDANAASALLTRNGVQVRVLYGAGEGHGYKKQVKEELRRSFDWVVEGDPNWKSDIAGL